MIPFLSSIGSALYSAISGIGFAAPVVSGLYKSFFPKKRTLSDAYGMANQLGTRLDTMSSSSMDSVVERANEMYPNTQDTQQLVKLLNQAQQQSLQASKARGYDGRY